MNKFLTPKILITFAIIVFVVLIIALFYKPATPLPQVLSSIPTPNAKKVNLVDPLKIKFDQNVDPSRITITSTPSEEWSITHGDDNSTIILKSKQFLRVETNYSLAILYDAKPISTLNFQTIAQQGDPRYTQGVLQDMARDYPLSTKLPYDTSLYHVVYASPLTLEITIKNKNVSSLKAIDDIKSWVKSLGADPSTHQYAIATPQ